MANPALFSDLKAQHRSVKLDWKTENVLVFGSGNFGTCLAFHLAQIDHQVTIFARDRAVVESINHRHVNEKYMPAVVLPSTVRAAEHLTAELLQQHRVWLFCIPTQHLRSVLQTLRQLLNSIQPASSQRPLMIFANKGIEMQSLSLPVQLVEAELPDLAAEACFLSGPSFASEVVSMQVTCVTMASRTAQRCAEAQEVFHAPHFRVYSSNDPVGVELAGALKNVAAIAAGVASGLGFQLNTRAALVTRALAEITRVGVALGASPLTFLGLAGVGDLMLTCSSEKSRNFTVGLRLGRGEKLDTIVSSLGSVAEGIPTAEGAYRLARKLNVDTPLIDEVWKMLYENKPPIESLKTLLLRFASADN